MITFGNFEAKISVDMYLHCCQNLTLSNVPTRRLLPGNPTTAASATVWGLNGHRQWLLGARNSITVIIERSDQSLRTKLLLMTFYDFLIRHFKKNVKSHVFWNLKKTKNTYSRTLVGVGSGQGCLARTCGWVVVWPTATRLDREDEDCYSHWQNHSRRHLILRAGIQL